MSLCDIKADKQCSLDMASVIWAQELQNGIKKARSVVEKLATEKNDEAQEMSQKLLSIGMMLKSTLRDVWMADDKLFEVKWVQYVAPSRAMAD